MATLTNSKICPSCKTERPYTEFGLHTGRKDALTSYCKPCKRTKGIVSYHKNKGHRNLENIRLNKISSKYNLSKADYAALVVKQKNLCAMCEKPEIKFFYKTGRVMNLAVDHCHKTNRVRGLLCHRCNVLIGFADESKELLLKAISYLIK